MMNRATTTLWRRAIACVIALHVAQLGWRSWPGDLPVTLAVVAALGLAGALLSLRRRAHPLWLGLALAGLAAVHELSRLSLGNYEDQIFQTAATGAGWLAGAGIAALALERSVGPGAATRRQAMESLAATGAAAGLGATYVCAAISKLAAASTSLWIDPSWLRLIALEHQPQHMGGLRASIFDLAVQHPEFALVGSTLTIVAELGACLLPFGPRARLVAGCGLLLLHLGIWVFTDILFIAGGTFLVVFTFDWAKLMARLRKRPQPSLEPPPALRPRPVALWCTLATVLIATSLLWLLPMERRRHAAPIHPELSHQPPTQDGASPAGEAPSTR